MLRKRNRNEGSASVEALPYFADFAKIACPILQDSSFIVKDSSPKIKPIQEVVHEK